MSTVNANETMEKSKTEKQNELDKMRKVLASIASEMQRFHDSTFESESDIAIPGYKEKLNVFGELLRCKSKIKSKRVCIKKLRKNLETACSVAKIVASAKEKESENLKQTVGSAQTECTDLIEKYQNNKQIINTLTKENSSLRNKLDNVIHFIHLGYEELQKIRREPTEEASVLEQLRKLIICCGQYYADYCNEHDECLNLKQNNNYLTNKSQILENNIEALAEQLKTLQYRNCRLQKENELIKERCNKLKSNDIELAFSEVRIKSLDRINSSVKDSLSYVSMNNEVVCNGEGTESQYKLDYEHGVDLSPHLTMVKKLLNCQDALLKDLKSISEEFLNNND